MTLKKRNFVYSYSTMIKKLLFIKNEGQLKDWEIQIIRKIDFLSSLGLFNITLSYFLFNLFHFSQLNTPILISIAVSFIAFVLNRLGRYLMSSYLFFFIGTFLLSEVVILMSLDTYSLLHFFPITMSVANLYGRKHTFSHLIIWMLIYLSNVVFLVFFYYDKPTLNIDADTKEILTIFNVLFSFFCGVALKAIISWNSIKLENEIKTNISEKELLLAELFHRVKNNLNLVNSLLNIRKTKVILKMWKKHLKTVDLVFFQCP